MKLGKNLVKCRGVETRAHGAQGVRGLKGDFREKLRFYWVKMDFEEKIDAFGEKLDKNSKIKYHLKRQKFGNLLKVWVKKPEISHVLG